MYLKWAGCILAVSISVLAGRRKAHELQIRVLRMEELKRMILLLQGEFRFHRSTLSEAFGNTADKVGHPFACFLKEMSEHLEEREGKGFDEIWTEHTNKLLLKEGFQKEDEKIFSVLKGSLGYLDFAMQMETLELVKLQLEEVIEEAKEQKEVKGKLYQTMGVTIGMFAALLLI